MCSSEARELAIVGSWELKGFLKFASTLHVVTLITHFFLVVLWIMWQGLSLWEK